MIGLALPMRERVPLGSVVESYLPRIGWLKHAQMTIILQEQESFEVVLDGISVWPHQKQLEVVHPGLSAVGTIEPFHG